MPDTPPLQKQQTLANLILHKWASETHLSSPHPPTHILFKLGQLDTAKSSLAEQNFYSQLAGA